MENYDLDSHDWGSEIGKMKKGDKVLVNTIAEPLQEQWTLVMRKKQDFNNLVEKLKSIYSGPDQMTANEAREVRMLDYEIDRLKSDFWIRIADQYGLWKVPSIGIRNGYCLVKTIGPEDIMKRLKATLDDCMEELNDDQD